jgi:hypothetical protein
VRSDPEFLHSGTRRLIFVRLDGLPLFWRVDLEIRSPAAALIDVDTDADAPDWSLGASAAANAVAAIKAVARGQFEVATGLLQRGFTRIGCTFDADESWPDAIARLARSAAVVNPSVVTFAGEISELVGALLPPTVV